MIWDKIKDFLISFFNMEFNLGKTSHVPHRNIDEEKVKELLK